MGKNLDICSNSAILGPDSEDNYVKSLDNSVEVWFIALSHLLVFISRLGSPSIIETAKS